MLIAPDFIHIYERRAFMRRLHHNPRPNWPALVESQGMFYHTADDVPYWDESVSYEFTRREIDELEAATYELNDRCLEAVDFVIEQDRLSEVGIPLMYHDYIRESWERDDRTIYGRFDFHYDGTLPPRLLEYNADTPTGLVEAAVVQWHWRGDCRPQADQFNCLHERLIEAWKELLDPAKKLYFVTGEEHLEDYMNVNYLRDTAIQAGWSTEYLDIDKMCWDSHRKRFLDQKHQSIECCFKLYPWEWMFSEPFGQNLLAAPTRWLEAPWKAVLSNKAILVILSEMFPGHPNLLQASYEPLPGDYVMKPVHSREGANVRLIHSGRVLEDRDGPYDGPVIYQEMALLPDFDGFHPCIGSWLVNGWASGLGIREDSSWITGNLSRFVPHAFL